MMKRFFGFILFSMTLGLVSAQDMPPLPPLPDQSQAANSNSNSSIPVSAPTPTPSASTALPPLPGDQSAPASQAAPASPALSAPAPPAGSDQSQAPSPAASPEPTVTSGAETADSGLKPMKKHRHPLKPWQVSKYRPDVIFGGWVKAKGGNESSRMAWTSQEVLNALLFKKYTLISPLEGKAEDGNYDGEPGSQWRLFTFNAPKSKMIVQVYIRQSGPKVWMRVGPGEGVFPEATSLKQATQIREADLTALHLLKKKFGRRLSPNRVVARWEAPYRYSRETADE
jgi:hypothetical protein